VVPALETEGKRVTVEDRIDLVDGEFWGRVPDEELTWLRTNAPVWWDPRNELWGISTYELVKHVSTHPKTFSSAQGIRPDYPAVPSMIDSDDPLHLQRRKIINKGFTPRRVRDQEEAIRRTARSLIATVAERGEFDLVGDVAAWLPLITIGDLLGVAPPDRQQLLTWSDDLMCALGASDPALREAQMAAAAGYFEYASKVVQARRQSPTDDLMSVLIGAEVDGHSLTDSVVQYESMLILIGGDETTRHVISGGAYQLLLERERWESLRADRSALGTAIEEMLRWVSPVKNMTRTATEDTDLAGQHIKAGDKLLLLYPSANRDEAVFKEPFNFDIRRTPNEHIAFGHGSHHCLGANLARLELQVLFEELLDLLPDLELVDPAAKPHHRPANFVSGLESLRVRVG
jgi:cytochrome P450 family 142 subfamily A polypeptide 1